MSNFAPWNADNPDVSTCAATVAKHTMESLALHELTDCSSTVRSSDSEFSCIHYIVLPQASVVQVLEICLAVATYWSECGNPCGNITKACPALIPDAMPTASCDSCAGLDACTLCTVEKGLQEGVGGSTCTAAVAEAAFEAKCYENIDLPALSVPLTVTIICHTD